MNYPQSTKNNAGVNMQIMFMNTPMASNSGQ